MRQNSFLLIVDTVIPSEDAPAARFELDFETARGVSAGIDRDGNAFVLRLPHGDFWTLACASPAALEQQAVKADGQLQSSGIISRFVCTPAGQNKNMLRALTVLYPGAPNGRVAVAQEGDTVALRLPEPALLRFQDDGGLMLETDDYCFGLGIKEIPRVFLASEPIEAEYDAATGLVQLNIRHNVKIALGDGRSGDIGPLSRSLHHVPKGRRATPDLDRVVDAMLARRQAELTVRY